MQMPFHHFLIPYVRRARFWEAIRVNGHKVFPLWPGSAYDAKPPHRGMFDQDVDDESIEYLQDREAEVGFPTGAINQTTVIEVTTAIAQDLMDELDTEPGACIWTPNARYYLFDYVEPSLLPESRPQVAGLRIVNDDEWIQYPGNLINGNLVHWEQEACAFGTHPLPREFWDLWVLMSS